MLAVNVSNATGAESLSLRISNQQLDESVGVGAESAGEE